MIKAAMEFISYLKEQSLEVKTHIDGAENEYFIVGDKVSKVKPTVYHQPCLEVSTLRGVIDYLNENPDGVSKVMIQVVSPTQVLVYDELDVLMERAKLVRSNAIIPSFPFDDFMSHERFIVEVMSKFLPLADYDYIIDAVSHLKINDGTLVLDNGVSQKATMERGIEIQAVELKPRVNLVPIRTFIEVNQPTAEFVFRVREGRGGGIECGLFASDGNIWKIGTIQEIHKFILDGLDTDVEVKVIS